MKIRSVRIKRMGIGTMTEIEKVGVNKERREGLRTIGEILMSMLMEYIHHGAMDLQRAAMSPRGVERKVATKTAQLKIWKMQSLAIGGTKRERALVGQSATGVELGEQRWTLNGWRSLSRR